MDEKRWNEIKARANAATPGAWKDWHDLLAEVERLRAALAEVEAMSRHFSSEHVPVQILEELLVWIGLKCRTVIVEDALEGGE